MQHRQQDRRSTPLDSTHEAKPDPWGVDQLLELLRGEGIDDERVLEAIRSVPRHELVPGEERPYSYANRPLPIGQGQTISQPYIVALMSQLGRIEPHHKVLEIGTGSGYQTAVLSKLGGAVYTIEIIEALSKRAQRDLQRLGLSNDVHFRVGDGDAGWPEAAPFDVIVVTAAPADVPRALVQQLRVGGRLIIPVGGAHQDLRLLTKTPTGIDETSIVPVRFVPMTGRSAQQDAFQS